MQATAGESSGSTSTLPHELRITNHGKMRQWIVFALGFFMENPERPLVLHTLPAAKPAGEAPIETAANGNVGPVDDEVRAEATAAKKETRMHLSMSTIPRLVSVVEIIKRQYGGRMDAAHAEEGVLKGLHQYNEVGELEVDAGSPEQDRAQALTQALQGKRHLRQHKVAYMKVTLSRKELPELVARGATYQPPAVRHLSKSARNRLKQKLKNAEPMAKVGMEDGVI